ncbi:MAG: hypothetical protein EXS38_07015 [Opitutus sp.]|nr:hypothetical protein [Opitutus sp.]
MRVSRALPLIVALFAVLAPSASAEVLIERTILPFDVAPSSFAIGLPGGVNFCFDPVRGGVCYAWTGGFIDLTNVRPGFGGKHISPVKLLGPVVYREDGNAPLRRGDPARPPVVEFKGYTLHGDAVEFRYTVDGFLLQEEIRARPGGGGLVRRFRIEGATDAKWWYVTDGKPARPLTAGPDGKLTLEISFQSPAP